MLSFSQGSQGLGLWVHFMFIVREGPTDNGDLELEKEGMPLEAGVSGAGEAAGT